MIKTYRATNSVNLFTSVVVDGKVVNLSFDGGFADSGGKVTGGTLSTSDENLQHAIENDSSYGKSFIAVGEAKKSDKVAHQEPSSLEKIEGVTNAQMAIEWLDANKNFKFDKRPDAATVRAQAAELGVVFFEWSVK